MLDRPVADLYDLSDVDALAGERRLDYGAPMIVGGPVMMPPVADG